MQLIRYAALLVILASTSASWAAPVNGIFSGEISYDCGDGSRGCDGFGLGLSVGDLLTGEFAFDPAAATPLSNDSLDVAGLFLSASIAGFSFEATHVVARFVPFNGFTETFWVQGQLASGLYMSVGLTSGFPIVDTAVPLRLDSDDWLLAAFKISFIETPPVAEFACEIDSICSTSFGRNLSVRTVPAPAPSVLVGMGLLLAGLARKRSARIGIR